MKNVNLYFEFIIKTVLGNKQGIFHITSSKRNERMASLLGSMLEKLGSTVSIELINKDTIKSLFDSMNTKEFEVFCKEYFSKKCVPGSVYLHLYNQDFDGISSVIPNHFEELFYKVWSSFSNQIKPVRIFVPTANTEQDTVFSMMFESLKVGDVDSSEKYLEIRSELKSFATLLNQKEFVSYRMIGSNTNLKFSMVKGSRWIISDNSNFPSFEIFCTPDYRSVKGTIDISFPQKLKHSVGEIQSIRLSYLDGKLKELFLDGKKVEALNNNFKLPSQYRLAEVSFTDSYLSPIKHYTGETLLDENIGGNTHIAIGNSIAKCIFLESRRDVLSAPEKFGFNISPTHLDIVQLPGFDILGYLEDGQEIKIFGNGKFLLK